VRLVILDNLREGVLSADMYDPTLNPLYRDVLAHYGAVALSCRVGQADRKGKVESAIGHTRMLRRSPDVTSRSLTPTTASRITSSPQRVEARLTGATVEVFLKGRRAASITACPTATGPMPSGPRRGSSRGRRRPGQRRPSL
jgi:transposase